MKQYKEGYAESWTQRRPHLPLPILGATTSSIMLEMIYRMELWVVKPGDPLFHEQPILGGYVLPPFQRPSCWTQEQQIRFIESAYLGLNLGSIVWVDASDAPTSDGKFAKQDRWLIDGQQRISAILAYTKGEFQIFQGTEHQHKFSDLNALEQRTFARIQIGSSKLTTTDDFTLRMAYDRLNFGGTAHKDFERAISA